jgi:arginase
VRVELLSVPYDSGVRGVRMGAGPEALLKSGLADRIAARGHGVSQTTIELPSDAFLPEVKAAFELDRRLAKAVSSAIARDAFPVVLSGNCISSLATVSGLGVSEPGVIWFDAHGDFNTPETTKSGFLDGMALAILTGRCWQLLANTISGFAPVRADHVMLIGARHFDEDESALLSATKVVRVSSDSFRKEFRNTLTDFGQRVRDVYLHVDLDVLDTSEGNANSFAVAGGLSLRELLDAIHAIGDVTRIRAVALTAYDPACDENGKMSEAATTVIEAAIDGNARQR